MLANTFLNLFHYRWEYILHVTPDRFFHDQCSETFDLDKITWKYAVDAHVAEVMQPK